MDDHIGVCQVFWQSHTPPPSPFHTQEGDISKKQSTIKRCKISKTFSNTPGKRYLYLYVIRKYQRVRLSGPSGTYVCVSEKTWVKPSEVNQFWVRLSRHRPYSGYPEFNTWDDSDSECHPHVKQSHFHCVSNATGQQLWSGLVVRECWVTTNTYLQ